MHQSWRYFRAAGAMCGIVFALSACSRSKPHAAHTTIRNTTGESSSLSGTSTTTTVADATSFSFDPDPSAPQIIDAGSDYKAIALSLLQYDDWLSAFDPDPTLIPRIAARGSTFDAAVRNDIGVLQRLDRRYYEVQSGPAVIKLVDQANRAVTLRYTQRIVVQRVVDRDGKITSEQKFSAPTTSYTILLTQMPDGRWLLADVEPASNS
jgi:hypothetical protein